MILEPFMLEKCLVETELKSQTLTLGYESAKADLAKINDYIASGAIFRSKVRWYEEGEKNTSYFLSLEKRNKARSHIRKIIDTNDVEINDEKMALIEINNFHSNLNACSIYHLSADLSYVLLTGKYVKGK